MNYYDISLNQLTRSTTNGVRTLCTYDANGNLTHKGNTSYSWNPENMLTGVSLDHWMENVHYTYDALGKRMGRRYLDEAEYIFKDTRYFFEGINILLEKSCDDYGAYWDGNCSYVTNAVYTLAPGVIGHIISVNRNGTYYYHHYDPIGNILFISDASGNRNTSYIQEGFGNVVSQSGSADNNYHLTTKEIDSDTGLYYFYARWYDPGLGRFVSKDLIPYSNRYYYTDNNPIRFFDPYGLSPEDVQKCKDNVYKIYEDIIDSCRQSAKACRWGCALVCTSFGLIPGVGLIGSAPCAITCAIGCTTAENNCIQGARDWRYHAFEECEKLKCR